jgi:branched-chain amino acid transport system substrate-binding protein
MVKQAKELGITKVKFAFGDGACTDEMGKLAGPAAEGILCSQAGIPTQSASKAFLDAFKAKYGDVKQYAPFTYDAANLLIAAMQKANSTDPAKYLPALHKIRYSGITANIEFDRNGDLTHGLMTISQVKSGKWEALSK